MMPEYQFERALFVVGEPDSGKSTQLRSIFRDVRLGTQGEVPPKSNLPDVYRLSNERCLYLRLTSPHEAKESLDARVALLSPDRHGTFAQDAVSLGLVDSLRALGSVDICSIDARDRSANGLLLADFFDFT
jgi:hypothetical protein